jgi:hypothetical protein
MATAKNWLYFIYINLAFIIYIFIIFYFIYIQEIKSKWASYRCNPIYMPLSDNIEKDFVYCVQNIQSNFMGYLLQPLTFVTKSMSSTLFSFVNEINMVRAMFDKIRTFTAFIIQSVFGVFLNLVIEFQKIMISIRDLMGKTIGIMVTLLYFVDGSIKTMNSTWNGPPGQIVRSLGKCFHPKTKVKLLNGDIKFMDEINLGDVLENGSIVESTMQIDNKNNPLPLFVIEKSGVNNEDIYVTGTHLILYNNDYITVDKYDKAKQQNKVTSDIYSCLITNDHKIKIGDEIFWDWEDHFIKAFF